jgi:hypothetical protein
VRGEARVPHHPRRVDGGEYLAKSGRERNEFTLSVGDADPRLEPSNRVPCVVVDRRRWIDVRWRPDVHLETRELRTLRQHADDR